MNDRLKNHQFFASIISKKVFCNYVLKVDKKQRDYFYNRTAYQRKRKNFYHNYSLEIILKKGLKVVLKFKLFETKVSLFIKLFVNCLRSFMF